MSKVVHFESAEDLKTQITALKDGEALSLDFPAEKAKFLQLSEYKTRSCENLFNAYMRSGVSEGSEFSLNHFIDYYTDLIMNREQEFFDSVLSLIGAEVYSFMNENGYAGRVVYNTATFAIFRKVPRKDS